MISTLTSMWPVLVLIVLLALAWGLLELLKAKRLPPSKQEGVDVESEVLPYAVRSGVLTEGERAFFPSLVEASRLVAKARQSTNPLILAKVRLADIVEVQSPTLQSVATAEPRSALTASQRTTAQNRINAKHVDFVLCHPQTTRPILVVELDDASHKQPHRQSRDEFVDRVCSSGPSPLPVIHIRAAARYDPDTIASELQKRLAPSRTAAGTT